MHETTALLENTAAVILAAGKGTRMKSELPKVLHPVLGRELVNYSVCLAQELGLPRVVAVVGYGREQVEAVVRTRQPDALFAVQEDQRGTGHAVLMAKDQTEGSQYVLVLYGDVPTLRVDTVRRMAQSMARSTSGVALPYACLCFETADPTGYGRAITDDAGHLLAIVEHRDCTAEQRNITLCNAGVYLARRDFLFDALGAVKTDNSQGEYYLTDIATIATERGTPGAVVVVDGSEVVGVNDRTQLGQLEQRFAAERNHQLMLDGVSLLAPDRIRVGMDVRVESDVVIHADVTLMGTTTVESGAVIGQGCVVTNTAIGAGATILPYCVMTDSRLGPATQVGPFAHVRPGTDLGARAKLGNFVETKKTTMGEGSKASHLTYLGDCEIGRDVNIGAGTITCNYDGLDKHKTVIQDRAFIGSNTEIVAPVNIGVEALIGAGTTVTRDVPDGGLAVSRAPQKNIDGWSTRQGPWARRRRKEQ
jgi:bifunctional UDP-N-acetylglucosamine pyrophosphorylase/glucosamine-1-phosphate N-acetyltransferase